MRLIDADAYAEKVCTYRETGCGDCKFQICCPNDQPTAYDIDKVVEQLKECRDKCVFDAEVHAYQTAVRIVKGGVTDET